jgi:signal recognition particle GTPase
MFDIKVQNGSIRKVTGLEIFAAYEELSGDLSTEEQEVKRLQIIANKRAEASNPKWVEDVRKRKLRIANGEGEVHHTPYDLKEQYGITLKPYKKN